MLNEKQLELLHTMETDMNAVPDSHYKYSDVLWSDLGNTIRGLVVNEGIGDVQSQLYNQSFSLIKGHINFEHALYLFYNLLKLKDTYKLLDITTALDTNDNTLKVNAGNVEGRPSNREHKLLTWDYVISMNTIINIAEYYPDIINKKLVVAELGAGWGRIAYYLTQINPNLSYNIFDVPPVLFIAHEYLNREVKHTPTYVYGTDNGEFNRRFLLRNPGIRYFLSNELTKVPDKTVDLFIAVANFQEMSIDQVTKYYVDINRTSKHFYNQQRYSDSLVCKHMYYDIYPKYDNWKTLIDQDVVFNPLWFEQLFKIK